MLPPFIRDPQATWRRRPAAPRQLDQLRELHVPVSQPLSAGEASEKIAEARQLFGHFIGMDQLYYFVALTHDFLTYASDEDTAFFWNCIERYCPDLFQAVQASFQGEWSKLFFTPNLHTPTFNVNETLLRDRELIIQGYVHAFHNAGDEEDKEVITD